VIDSTRGPGGRDLRVLGSALFAAVAVAGIFYVKWDPYFLKAFKAASAHTLGPSIVSGTSGAAPPFSFAAAVDYGIAYFKAIWEALVVALLLGAGVQTLLPADWLRQLLGRADARSSALAGLAAVPSMMCTCCAAPLAVGLRRANASPGAVLAYWIGNPVLNPATIIFLGFVLGWGWALLRIAIGALLVATVAWYGDRFVPHTELQATAELDAAPRQGGGGLIVRWLRTALNLAIGLVPEYLVIVLVLGAVRSLLFPAMSPAIGGSVLLFVALTVAGTLFVVPTAGEVAILQTLFAYGLGPAGGGALMLTLPAVSLPSLWMVAKAVPRKNLLAVAAIVTLFGLLTGLLALLLGLR